MTYFIPEGQVAPVKARGPDLPVQDFSDAVGAGYDLSQMETNANFRVDRELAKDRRALVESILPRFTDAELMDYAASQGVDGTITRREAELLALGNDSGAFLDIARSKAEADPAAWEGIDLSDKAREDAVNRRLQAEHAAAQDVLAMTPGAAGVIAPFIGGMAGVTADARNAPFLLIGGGQGSFLRGLATAAAANVVAEAAFLPSQFAMAERLNIPDPDVLETLGMAAAGGAALEAGVRGLGAGGRALAHAFRRQQIPTNIPTLEPQWRQIVGDAIEDAMASGDDPLRAAAEALEHAPQPRPEPERGLPPLVPDDPPAAAPGSNVDQMAQPVDTPVETPPQGAATLAPDQETSPASQAEPAPAAPEAEPAPAADLPPELRRVMDDVEEAADAAVLEALGGKKGQPKRFPLLDAMKRAGIRINPDSPEGQELYGILGGAREANRAMPGLFSRKATARPEGSAALDNMVASEWEERFPGITDAVGVENGNLDPRGVAELIRRESAGDWGWMRRVQEADAMRAQVEDARRTPVDDFLEGRSPEDGAGFFVDRTAVEMFPEDWPNVERRFDEWLDRTGYRLLDREREEILYELRNRGGDAEYLVEQAMSRELDAAEYAVLRPVEERAVDESLPFGNGEGQAAGDAAPIGSAAGEPGPSGGEPGTGRAGEGQPASPAVERTDAGDQLVIPGAERVDPAAGLTQRQQAEVSARAQQSMIRRGEQTRVEDDPGTLFGAGAQPDMFDDPASGKPAVRAYQDNALGMIPDNAPTGFAPGKVAEMPQNLRARLTGVAARMADDGAVDIAHTSDQFARLGLTDKEVSDISAAYFDFLSETAPDVAAELRARIAAQSEAVVKDRLASLSATSEGPIDMQRAKLIRDMKAQHGSIYTAVRRQVDLDEIAVAGMGDMLSSQAFEERIFGVLAKSKAKNTIITNDAEMRGDGPIDFMVNDLAEWAFFRASIQDVLTKQVDQEPANLAGPPSQSSAPASWELEYDGADPTRMDLIRGSGRADRGAAYGAGDSPILGEGTYYFINDGTPEVRERARSYGPNIETARIDQTARFLEIRDMQQWRDLTKEAGWEYPNPIGGRQNMATLTEGLKRLVMSRGYDGIVVDPLRHDNLFQTLFDGPQIVDYRPKGMAAATGVHDAAGNWTGFTDFDGNPLKTSADAKQYLDDLQEWAEVINLCGRGKE